MQPSFKDFVGKKIHFVGVNGVGVNALARYALDCGCEVSGSDRRVGDYCEPLKKAGCDIKEGENVGAAEIADALVYTSAISVDNPELSIARSRGIPIFERQEFLSLASEDFDVVVGVAGSHGKTTVTAMLTHILACAGANFVSMIGGDAIKYGNYVNNISCERDKIFVTEACEFRRHMLSLSPSVAVVLNTDWDHPDSYPTRESVENAFQEYLNKAKTKVYLEDGSVVLQNDRDTFVFECDENLGVASVFSNGQFVGNFGEHLQGEYNRLNALFAVAVACALKIKTDVAIKAVNSFCGVKRRFEKVGEIDGAPIVFDFAHHPTEIKNLLERVKPSGKKIVVFQPHTYSRTRAYMDDFANVFLNELTSDDTLILLPTYAAREQRDESSNSDALMKRILSKNAKSAVYLAKNNISSVEFVKMMSKGAGIILFVGAGDIYDLKGCFEMNK